VQPTAIYVQQGDIGKLQEMELKDNVAVLHAVQDIISHHKGKHTV